MYFLVGSRIFCGKFLAYAVSYIPNVFVIRVCFVFQAYIPVVMIDEPYRQVLRYPRYEHVVVYPYVSNIATNWEDFTFSLSVEHIHFVCNV